MSLFGKIAALFGGSSARSVCVVDGDRMVGGDRVGPGERFQALNKLARFASREGLKVKVVFGGRPLREADDGSNYNGVEVYYGESPVQVRERLEKTLASSGRGSAVLVTADAELESDMAARGYAVMRVATLRKAMENAGGESSGREGGGSRDDGNRRGRNRNRGRGRDRDRRGGGGEGNRNAQENSGNGSASENQNQNRNQESSPAGGGDPVKSLIDLVE